MRAIYLFVLVLLSFYVCSSLATSSSSSVSSELAALSSTRTVATLLASPRKVPAKAKTKTTKPTTKSVKSSSKTSPKSSKSSPKSPKSKSKSKTPPAPKKSSKTTKKDTKKAGKKDTKKEKKGKEKKGKDANGKEKKEKDAKGAPAEKEIKNAFDRFRLKYKKKANPATMEKRYQAFKRRYIRAKAREEESAKKRKEKGFPPRAKKLFDAMNTPLGDVDEADFKKKFLGGAPKPGSRSHNKVKVGGGRKRGGAAKARFQQRRTDRILISAQSSANPMVIPSTKDVKAPQDIGDNKGKGLKGGDNKGKGLKGGGGEGTEVTKADMQDDISMTGWRPAPKGMFGFKVPNGRMIVDLSRSFFPPVVRNQGTCKSCWAVVATEHWQAVLTATALLPFDGHGMNPRLSAQQVIDCDEGGDDHGCNGGTVTGAFDFLATKGVVIAPQYPYPLDGQKHACAQPKALPGAFNKDIKYWKARDSLFLVPPCLSGPCPANADYEAKMLDWFQNPVYKRGTSGEPTALPLVAYVDASKWDDYSAGVYPSGQCSSAGKDLTHIIQIVGVGIATDTNKKFWLIRNSWGGDWGEDGHIRLPFGENACGIMNYVVYLDGVTDFAKTEYSRKQEKYQEMANNSPQVKKLQEMQEMMNNSPQAKKMREFQEMANNSPQAKKMRDLQEMINNSPRVQNGPLYGYNK